MEHPGTVTQRVMEMSWWLLMTFCSQSVGQDESHLDTLSGVLVGTRRSSSGSGEVGTKNDTCSPPHTHTQIATVTPRPDDPSGHSDSEKRWNTQSAAAVPGGPETLWADPGRPLRRVARAAAGTLAVSQPSPGGPAMYIFQLDVGRVRWGPGFLGEPFSLSADFSFGGFG